jgi:hypothetical protein
MKRHSIDINHLSLPHNIRFITKEIILNHLTTAPKTTHHSTPPKTIQHSIHHSHESSIPKPEPKIQAYNVDIKDSTKNLNEYKTALPHIYFNSSCQADQLLESLETINSK